MVLASAGAFQRPTGPAVYKTWRCVLSEDTEEGSHVEGEELTSGLEEEQTTRKILGV